MKSKKVALCGVHIHLYLCEESTMSENKKGKPKKSEQGSETERVTKRRIGKRERKRKGEDGQRGGTGCLCKSRRLAICVVFYDNYKYGRKALCLEQLVRLSKLYPYSPLPLAEAI